MSNINKKWAVFALLWFFLLMYALLLKPTGHTPKIPNTDKIAHLMIFFGQFWLVGRSMLALPIKTYWSIGGGLALMLAVGSEALQGLTGYRSVEFLDGVADMVGAVGALWLVQWADEVGYLKKK
ncbi:MAG: hypothetical protein Q4C68_07485 [Moraxella sp.]|nr:hypothetical protein [Moraxella sp.]